MEECSRRGSNQRMRPKRARKPTISNRWFSVNFRLALTRGSYPQREWSRETWAAGAFLSSAPLLPHLGPHDQLGACKTRMSPVLHLDPFAAAPGSIAAIASLGDDAF